MKNLHPVVDILISDLPQIEHRNGLGFVPYVQEHRTIDLRVPRQTGKTTYLTNMFYGEESLMIVPNQMHVKPYQYSPQYSYRVMTADYFNLNWFDRFRGIRNMYNFKYLLIDEPRFMTPRQECNVLEFIETLYVQNCLDEDFFVLKLGT